MSYLNITQIYPNISRDINRYNRPKMRHWRNPKITRLREARLVPRRDLVQADEDQAAGQLGGWRPSALAWMIFSAWFVSLLDRHFAFKTKDIEIGWNWLPDILLGISNQKDIDINACERGCVFCRGELNLLRSLFYWRWVPIMSPLVMFNGLT